MYGCCVIGSFTSQMTASVGVSHSGSTRAVEASGIRIMSDSWISWKPRMLDPSKPMPSTQMDRL